MCAAMAICRTRRQRALALSLLPRLARGLALTPTVNVEAAYAPLQRHPHLFDKANVEQTWLHPDCAAILEAVRAADANVLEDDAATVCRSRVAEEARQIFSFPLLRDELCQQLIEEVENFQETGLPARRPNSMNNYGLVLNSIGLRPALNELQRCLHPIARALFPVEGAQFDGHHSFVVSYKPEEDRGLDMHTDDSDVTLNVCLGKDFTAAGLSFCGDLGTPDHRVESFRYQHQRGTGLLHLGRRYASMISVNGLGSYTAGRARSHCIGCSTGCCCCCCQFRCRCCCFSSRRRSPNSSRFSLLLLRRHGADDISEGHRINLIMWNHNQKYRASPAFRARPYFREEGPPDAQCVSFTHDRDFESVVGDERPSGSERFGETAWCPPPHAEYEGFDGKGGRYRDRLKEDPNELFLN